MGTERNYSRKQFIAWSVGTILASYAHNKLVAAVHSQSLPVNATDRRVYAWNLLQELCTDIGPRATGTEGYFAGAQIIHAELQKSLPSVLYDNYPFNQWELTDPAQMFVDGQAIETYLAIGSQGTPVGGLSGRLSHNEGSFVLVNPQNSEIQANITINKYGKAIPIDKSVDQPSIPFFGVGRQDMPVFERAVQMDLPVHLRAQARFSPNGKGINVIGQLPGKKKDEILFLAHADTVYSTPGAIDNTASVIVMILLAHEAAKRGDHQHTLTFAATDGEEYGLLGAKNYATVRTALNTMKDIRYVINFDSLTWGPNLWVNSLNDEVKEIIRSIHSDLNIKSYPRFESNDGFSMDSAPFRPSEGRALHVNSRGYDEKTLPRYHRPDDTAEHVPLDCIENAFQVFNAFIKRIDKQY